MNVQRQTDSPERIFTKLLEVVSATGSIPKFGTGFTPTTRTLTPINPGAAMTPSGGFKNAAQKPFGVSKVFPKISLGKWPPGGSTGTALPQSPYQSKSTGWNPFSPQKK